MSMSSNDVEDARGGSQDAPLLAQNQTSTSEQVDGIVAQTRADLGDESSARFAEVLRQRFSDAGMTLTDEQIADLARRAGSTATDDGALDDDRDGRGGTSGA